MTVKTSNISSLVDVFKSSANRSSNSAGNNVDSFADQLKRTTESVNNKRESNAINDNKTQQSVENKPQQLSDNKDLGTVKNVGEERITKEEQRGEVSEQKEQLVTKDGEKVTLNEVKKDVEHVKTEGAKGESKESAAAVKSDGSSTSSVQTLVVFLAEFNGGKIQTLQQMADVQKKIAKALQSTSIGLSQEDKQKVLSALNSFNKLVAKNTEQLSSEISDGQNQKTINKTALGQQKIDWSKLLTTSGNTVPGTGGNADASTMTSVANEVVNKLNKLVNNIKSGSVASNEKIDVKLQRLVEALAKVNGQVVSLTGAGNNTDSGLGLLNKKSDLQQLWQDEKPTRSRVKTELSDMDKLAALVERKAGVVSSVNNDQTVATIANIVQPREQRIENINRGQDVRGLTMDSTIANRNQQVTSNSTANVARTIDFQEIYNQTVERMRMTTRAGQSEMVMKLNPDSLGELTMKVAVKDGVMTAVFRSEQADVRQALEANLQQMKQELQQAGIKVDNVEISANLTEDFTRQQENQDSSRQQSGRRTAERLGLDKAEDENSTVINELEGDLDYRV